MAIYICSYPAVTHISIPTRRQTDIKMDKKWDIKTKSQVPEGWVKEYEDQKLRVITIKRLCQFKINKKKLFF